ncbi:MAG: hypothetical protein ACP5QK_04525 [Myxococcota bacterium]
MINRFNDNLLLLKNLICALKIQAVRALEDANDDGCRALYNDIVKDSEGYLDEIEKEIEGHKKKGKWE